MTGQLLARHRPIKSGHFRGDRGAGETAVVCRDRCERAAMHHAPMMTWAVNDRHTGLIRLIESIRHSFGHGLGIMWLFRR